MVTEKNIKVLTVNLADAKAIGQNIKAIVEGKYLVLVIDTTVNLGASKSGKMNAVAQTGGFADFGKMKGNIYIGTKNQSSTRNAHDDDDES